MPWAAGTILRRGRDLAGVVSPLALFQAASRAGSFAAQSVARFSVRPSMRKYPELPLPMPTLPLMTSVFAEELMLGGMVALHHGTRDSDELRRVGDDTDRALEVLDANGWLDEPGSYHRTPPPPEEVVAEPATYLNIRYGQLSFESGYRPVHGLPGSDRWLAMEANRRCYAHVMEHRGAPRPWLVLLHGHMMGGPLDLVVLRALQYHRDLGFNVLAPVLPLHGPRRNGGLSGSGLVSLDWVSNVHGLTQAVWDVRRWLAWIRDRGGSSIAVHGMSLGGYTAALVAGLDGSLDCVIAGVPGATIHRQLIAACYRDPWFRRAAERHDLLEDRVEAVHKVVTPTAFPCRVPHDRRFIYAGLGDRMSTPGQPRLLWEHWGRPAIYWSSTTHLFTVTSPSVRRFVSDAITECATQPGNGTILEALQVKACL